MVVRSLLILLGIFASRDAASEEIVPITQYRCGPTTATLMQRMILQLDSPAYLLMDRNDFRAKLVQSVLEAYNELAFQSCDIPHFRRLESVLAVVPNEHEDIHSENILTLELVGHCRNCTESMTLFDDHASNLGVFWY